MKSTNKNPDVDTQHLSLNHTVTAPPDDARRRVTYDAMLEDWLNLSEEPATPEEKMTRVHRSEPDIEKKQLVENVFLTQTSAW